MRPPSCSSGCQSWYRATTRCSFSSHFVLTKIRTSSHRGYFVFSFLFLALGSYTPERIKIITTIIRQFIRRRHMAKVTTMCHFCRRVSSYDRKYVVTYKFGLYSHRVACHKAPNSSMSELRAVDKQEMSTIQCAATVPQQVAKITKKSPCSSGSFKVIEFVTNWKGICDFLLVVNSNNGCISHGFRAAATVSGIYSDRLGPARTATPFRAF